MSFFRKRIFVWDAVQHTRKFLFANGKETLEFVCARMEPKLIGHPTRFEMRKEEFPDSWAYGAFSVAAVYDTAQARELVHYGKTKTGYNFDKATFDSFISHNDILNDVGARYKMLRLLFACNFNKPDIDKTVETLHADGLDVQGKVHQELLTCARYVMHVGKEFKIASS